MSFREDMEAAEAAEVPHWRLATPIVLGSLGGTHQLHRFVGRWSDGEVGEWAVLTDTATGAAVLDMAGVKTGSAVWRADGCLLVRLRGGGDQRFIIVDPDIRTFRHIGYDQRPRPIAELQAAMGEAARQVGADGRPAAPDDPWLQRDFGPDGHVMVEYGIQSQRMSHETRTPKIVDVATGEVLLSFSDSMFDGSVSWREGGTMALTLRHYDQQGGMVVLIDPARRTWSIAGRNTGDLPLATISDDLPRRFRKLAVAPMPVRDIGKAGKAITWAISALMVGALLLVAVFAYSRLTTSNVTPQKLTPLPTVPVSR